MNYEITYIHKVTKEVRTEVKHAEDTVTLYQIAKMFNNNGDVEKILSIKELNPNGRYAVIYEGWIRDYYNSYAEAKEALEEEIEYCKKHNYKFDAWAWKIRWFPNE
jgi:hypothetical protein